MAPARDDGPAANPLELAAVGRVEALLDFGLVCAVAFLVPALIRLGYASVAAAAGLTAHPSITIRGKYIEAALVCAAAFYVARRRRLSPAALGIRGDGLSVQLAWGIGGVLACFAWLVLTVILLIPLFPIIAPDLRQRAKFFELLPINDAWLQIVLLVAVVVHEELLFRGLLLTQLRRLTGRWWAALAIASAIFGALHLPQGLIGVFQVTGLGVVLGVVFIGSRSLLAAMLSHFLFNFLQLRLLPLYMRWAERSSYEWPAGP